MSSNWLAGIAADGCGLSVAWMIEKRPFARECSNIVQDKKADCMLQ
ncbi:MAG: hypothetical protein H6656_03335 [Ardenticatenaceae bacterium]|nr:hypothetical protein [Ardenticatenaceae bacterium]